MASTTYTHTTLSTLRAQLASRLGDPTSVYWVTDELNMYIAETLRVFNCVTGFHRITSTFNTTAGVAFYDLTSSLPGSVRAYTLTDQNPIALMQYQLMEPKSVLSWTGSEMFTLDEFVRAIERRRNQFLADTAVRITQTSFVIGPVDYLDLPDTVLAVMRIVWKSPTGAYYHILSSDEDMFSASSPRWRTAVGIPSGYSIAAEPTLSLQFNGSFPSSGTLEVLTVSSGAALNPTANANTGTLLGIPDDLAWGVRFGAMADLLRKEGPARDESRASFCETMYLLSVDWARNLPVLLVSALNSLSIITTPLDTLDGCNYGWQGKGNDAPTSIGIAGPNLIAFKPVPDGIYSFWCISTRNAVVPVLDTDYIQASRDDLGAILAWAEMLATFKSQGSSFENAKSSAQLMFMRMSAYTKRRELSSPHLQDIVGQSTAQMKRMSVYGADNGGDGTGNSGSGGDNGGGDADDGESTTQSRGRANSARAMRKRLGGR